MLKQIGLPDKLKRLSAPAKRAPPLVKRFCETRNLRIADCSQTITGTHKDFRSAGLLGQFGNMDPIFYSVTMGNAGFSLGTIARIYNRATGRNVRVVNIVDTEIDEERRRILEEVSIIVPTDLRKKILSQNELLHIATEHTNEQGLFIYAEKGIFSCRGLVEEALGHDADYIILPLGSGELLDNFIKGLAEQRAHGLRTPRIIGVTIKLNIFANSDKAEILDGFTIADKLRTPTSIFIDEINGQAKKFGVDIVVVSDPEILEAVAVLEQSGIRSEPSAAAAFAGLRKAQTESRLEDDANVIVINTGYGLV